VLRIGAARHLHCHCRRRRITGGLATALSFTPASRTNPIRTTSVRRGGARQRRTALEVRPLCRGDAVLAAAELGVVTDGAETGTLRAVSVCSRDTVRTTAELSLLARPELARTFLRRPIVIILRT